VASLTTPLPPFNYLPPTYPEYPDVSFRVYGIPAPKGSKTAFVRGGRAVVVDGSSPSGRQKLASWNAEVAREAQNVFHEDLLTGPLHIDISFYFPRPKSAPRSRVFPTVKPDIDKITRSTYDAMTGVLYKDDALIVSEGKRKLYAHDGEAPGAFIRIYEIKGLD
jgi:Holliday junction resolvase RusA-like endonuclease